MDLIVSCGVLVLRRNPALEFLLLQHTDRWDLPKGHVDPGETEIECALRELEEETGIPADGIRLDPDSRYEQHYMVRTRRAQDGLRPKKLVIFPGLLLGPFPVAVTEHSGYQWFPWRPPHRIQAQTIDPLLEAAAAWIDRPDHPLFADR